MAFFSFALYATWGATLSAALNTLPGCGALTLGQGTQNDPIPTGTIVAQGNFQSANGETVSGTVAVYQTTNSDSTCNFTVRLQNLSAPSVAGLQVIPTVNGAPSISPSFYVLRAPVGNENYVFTTPTNSCSASFAQVAISNPSVTVPGTQNYGVATLNPL